MIFFKNVTKIYENGVRGADGATFYAPRGDFVFIVGPSGSGKTTLIKLLLKEIEPSRGEIFINGINATALKKSRVPYLRRGIGAVFQDFRLLAEKTVFENVAFAMRVIGEREREIQKRVPRVLGMAGILARAASYPEELSGGERQRAALARAVVNNPPILLADEPTGNLDPEASWEIMRLLEKINSFGTTVIVATHEKSIVDKMRKRVIALNNGAIESDIRCGVYDLEKPYEDFDLNHSGAEGGLLRLERKRRLRRF